MIAVLEHSSVTELVNWARAGDSAAWGEIVERFAPLIWGVCRRHRLSPADSHDVGQNVWIRLLEHLPRIHEPEKLPGWLATTTSRECLRFLEVSRKVAARQVSLATDAIPETDGADPDERLIEEERDLALRTAFNQLPERCRQLLSLLMRDPPASYAEIHRVTGRAVGGIGPSRERCLEKLRQCPAFVTWLRETGGPEGGAR